LFKEKEEIMFLKQAFIKVSVILFLLQFSGLPLAGQLKELCRFKGVEIPFRLKHQDIVLKKGKYDLEALILRSQILSKYYLKIKKGGKVLCQLDGEPWNYVTEGMYMMRDPKIPDKPTMKLRKNSTDKLIIFIIETGKKNRMSPLLRLRFKMEYEE
jgi:hypothetical protein